MTSIEPVLKPTTKEPNVLSVRMSDALLKRIDDLVESMNANPYTKDSRKGKINRNYIIREALYSGVWQLERCML